MLDTRPPQPGTFTAAGAGLAGVLYQLLTGGFGDAMLRTMFRHVLGMLGIG